MEVAQPGVEFPASSVGECRGRVPWASAVGECRGRVPWAMACSCLGAEGFGFFGARIGF